jgi:hypothetical protein
MKTWAMMREALREYFDPLLSSNTDMLQECATLLKDAQKLIARLEVENAILNGEIQVYKDLLSEAGIQVNNGEQP